MNTAAPPPPLSQLHRTLAEDAADKRPTDTADQGPSSLGSSLGQRLYPWDSKDVQPALKELVDSKWHEVQLGGTAKWGEDSVTTPGSKALIAGCGRGYDAAFFAARGLVSLGLDLSPIAVQAAQVLYEATENAPKDVEFRAADFFKFPPPVAGFDLAYDYTFFCAIPPKLRQLWADRYAQVIRKGGVLITLMFPIGQSAINVCYPSFVNPPANNDVTIRFCARQTGRKWGPPYSVPEKLYDQYLNKNFEKVYSETPGVSMEERRGREKMAVWKRR
ncbi:BQ2448_4505 [Microbotryum intermedium]|uniref:BQ2448_4505 protein n=1 Tax=Microbotryum intermedium TaxID=269621 RepID=A0A238FI43_9BASI|nr:BQ2448_4505 [Microbotryum intermedium]